MLRPNDMTASQKPNFRKRFALIFLDHVWVERGGLVLLPSLALAMQVLPPLHLSIFARPKHIVQHLSAVHYGSVGPIVVILPRLVVHDERLIHQGVDKGDLDWFLVHDSAIDLLPKTNPV